ncbi:MAG: serine--tRNA ligase [Phycisphaerales bacterium]|nr:serine--tRNA ligase [Phycisphaerales bacterium]
MIDLKALRENPAHFAQGAALKNIDVDIDRIIELDASRRAAMTTGEQARADQKAISREVGPQIGKAKGALKNADEAERATLEAQIAELEAKPAALKATVQAAEAQVAELSAELDALLLHVPLPPDDDVPRGAGAQENVEIRQWHPEGWNGEASFQDNRGFAPRTHLELIDMHDLVDFPRGVKIAGTRHYALKGDGMRLHQAVLRMAFDLITQEHGFTPMSVPVIVRESCMEGTGFFPEGRDQAYHIEESNRGAGHDLYLTGTGEVGLMGLYADEILDAADLPMKMATVSTCFRREAGAAGRDTAGLYRIHQFDKVEQVVIDIADPDREREHHAMMIGIVEELLHRLELPYRLLQCCTGDLGPKNADMIDIECWMPGRGDLDGDDRPTGDWGETHSASRLHDFQCRRLNLRYRDDSGGTTFCWSLNNTVAASPRLLIPLLEMHQLEDGTIQIPAALQPYMGGQQTIGGS